MVGYIKTSIFPSHAPARLSVLGWLLLAGILLFAPTASAQTSDDALRFSQRDPAVGARMMGLGGASVSGLADYTALFSNPAGLGYFESSLLTGSLSTLSTADDALFQTQNTSNALSTDIRATNLSGLGYVYRAPTAQGSLVFGLSYNRINTWDRDLRFSGDNATSSMTDFLMPVPGEFSASSVPSDYDEELFFGQYIVEDDAGNAYLVDFDPDGDGAINRPLSYIAFETFGIDFSPSLFESGAEVPFLEAVEDGTTILQAGRVTEDGSMQSIDVGGAVEAAPNLMLGLSVNINFGAYDFTRSFEEEDVRNENDGNFGTTDFDFLRLTESIRSELIGIGARGGLSAQIAPNVRAGLSIETPTFFSIDESYDTLLETFFDNGDSFVYGGDVDDVGGGEFEYQIRTPWRFSGGLAARVLGLTLLADAEFVDWTQMQFSADHSESYFDDLNLDIRDNLDAIVNTRFGAEYSIGNLSVRGGVAFQPDPRQVELDRSKTFYSAGFGYRFTNQLQFDFGWMQERFDDQYLPYVEVVDAPVVDEEVIRNRFAAGLSYRF